MSGHPQPHDPGPRSVITPARDTPGRWTVPHHGRPAAPRTDLDRPEVPRAASRSFSLAAQSLEIIDSILADPNPGLAGIQEQLRRCVAAYPGFPDKALLAHMLETRRQANSHSRQAGRT